ncbi:MAG: hypothetical protein IJW89_02920 [Clostridia bacterium]|nr:hypothetical protein [Clostridia bacterium]
MKSVIRVTLMMLLTVMLLAAAVVPAAAAAFNFDAAIQNFTVDAFNDRTLTIGESEEARGAIWTMNGDVDCLTSNPQVVTIDENGVVTAVGEGVAFVAIAVDDHVNAVTRYTVTAVGQTDDTDGDNSQQGVTPPTIHMDTDGFGDTMKSLFKGIFIGILCLLGGASVAFIVFVTVSTQKLSSQSMKTKELPEMEQTPATMVPTAALTFCTHCGKPFDGKSFCTQCGAARGEKGVYEVPTDGGMRAKDFEEAVNQWLAQNPYVADCRISIKTHNSLISPFVQRKFYVEKATIEYTLSDTPRQHKLGVAFIYKFRMFGPIGYNEKKHVEEWKENNPDCKVISTHGGHLQHFGTRSGFYAQYYNYVLFRK